MSEAPLVVREGQPTAERGAHRVVLAYRPGFVRDALVGALGRSLVVVVLSEPDTRAALAAAGRERPCVVVLNWDDIELASVRTTLAALREVSVVIVGPSDEAIRRSSFEAGVTYVETESSLDHVVRSIESASRRDLVPAGSTGDVRRADVPPPSTGDGYEGLTSREQEVAELVAAGRSNDEIADALTISRQTAKNHVWNVFRRLGVHGRAEFFARFARNI